VSFQKDTQLLSSFLRQGAKNYTAFTVRAKEPCPNPECESEKYPVLTYLLYKGLELFILTCCNCGHEIEIVPDDLAQISRNILEND
jgi:hypothetical protein